MDSKFYVALRPQINDHHAVHKEGCPFLPDTDKRIYLGAFSSVKDAIKESHIHFVKTKNCLFCSGEHKTGVEEFSQQKPGRKNKIISKIHISFLQSLICCLN